MSGPRYVLFFQAIPISSDPTAGQVYGAHSRLVLFSTRHGSTHRPVRISGATSPFLVLSRQAKLFGHHAIDQASRKHMGQQ
jgi:hypothetical protein